MNKSFSTIINSLYARSAWGLISVFCVMSMFAWHAVHFNTKDEVPSLIIIDAAKQKEFSAFTVKIKTGLFIKNFPSFDMIRNYFLVDCLVWFEMYPDDALNQLCKQMDISTVSRERIEMEFDKMLLKSNRPSLGIRWIKHIGRFKEVLPELYATIGVQQDPRWHKEGDVFEHTMQALDAAARNNTFDDENRISLMLAALCHDLGKVTTTQISAEKITSYGHDVEGVPLTKIMLARITGKKDRIAIIAKLVRYHMLPLQFVADGAKPAAYRRLALKLSPQTNMRMLAALSCADRCGRNAGSEIPLTADAACADVQKFITRAKKAHVYDAKEAPIVLGRDLQQYVEPGPRMGELVKKAYALQIDEGIQDKETLIKKVLNRP